MIQRIQTVYLLLVAIWGILTLCFPIMGICSPDVGLSKIYALGSLPCVCMGVGAIWSKLFAVMALLVPILALVTIFMFKKRRLQIRLSIAIVLLILLFYLFSIMFLATSYRHISETIPHIYGSFSLSLPFGFFFNLIGLVLAILAIVAIRKDENMVRSLDRIR